MSWVCEWVIWVWVGKMMYVVVMLAGLGEVMCDM